MAEPGIRFITFGISPYCEKARWALDWHRIPYREIGWPPGLHQILAKRCGAKSSALPILLEGDTVVQGSSAIIDWAERHAEDCGRRLAPPNGADEAQEIERRSNEIIAVHVRRLAFAEMLPNYAHFVKPGMFERTSGWRAIRGHMAELGIISAKGRNGTAELLQVIANAKDDRLPPVARFCLEMLARQYAALTAEIGAVNKRIHAWHRSCEQSRRLEEIPGIGPIVATALVAEIGDWKQFRSGRSLAAWIGLVPKQHSTGGKDRLGSTEGSPSWGVLGLLV